MSTQRPCDYQWDQFLSYFFDMRAIRIRVGDYGHPEIMIRATILSRRTQQKQDHELEETTHNDDINHAVMLEMGLDVKHGSARGGWVLVTATRAQTLIEAIDRKRDASLWDSYWTVTFVLDDDNEGDDDRDTNNNWELAKTTPVEELDFDRRDLYRAIGSGPLLDWDATFDIELNAAITPHSCRELSTFLETAGRGEISISGVQLDNRIQVDLLSRAIQKSFHEGWSKIELYCVTCSHLTPQAEGDVGGGNKSAFLDPLMKALLDLRYEDEEDDDDEDVSINLSVCKNTHRTLLLSRDLALEYARRNISRTGHKHTASCLENFRCKYNDSYLENFGYSNDEIDEIVEIVQEVERGLP